MASRKVEWDKVLHKLLLLDKHLLASHKVHQPLVQIPKVGEACLGKIQVLQLSRILKEVEGYLVRHLNQLLVVVYSDSSHRTLHLVDHLYLQLQLKLTSKTQGEEEDCLVLIL